MQTDREKLSSTESSSRNANEEKAFISSQLFRGKSAILIDHRGELYTLRITQLGKLILTK
ncbi:hemin uptake protein HemP [Polynucleobacter meluiroseus]